MNPVIYCSSKDERKSAQKHANCRCAFAEHFEFFVKKFIVRQDSNAFQEGGHCELSRLSQLESREALFELGLLSQSGKI